MRITRLGEGIDRTGLLSPAAVKRTLSTLEEFASVMQAHGVERRFASATSAVRDAANAEIFLEPAHKISGVMPSVLSGQEEGRLSYLGATMELDSALAPYVVVDVGGGSTELVTEAFDGSIVVASMDIGCVRATERFFTSDPPCSSEVAAAAGYTDELVTAALDKYPGLRKPAELVGLAGTVSALAVLILGLSSYDRDRVHHARLQRAAIEETLAQLAGVPVVERRRVRGMEQARADVIVGGTVVLAATMRALGHTELIVSESDILDGMVAELLAH